MFSRNTTLNSIHCSNEHYKELTRNMCDVCGLITLEDGSHGTSRRHRLNQILFEYKNKRKSFYGNRNGAYVSCDVTKGHEVLEKDSIKKKIRISVKPRSTLKFVFNIKNESRNNNLKLLGLQLAHPQEQFALEENPYSFDNPPYVLRQNDAALNVTVRFEPADIGQFQMPILFSFQKQYDQVGKNKKKTKNIIIIREMVIIATEGPQEYKKNKSPFKNRTWRASKFVKSTKIPNLDHFAIPKPLKVLLTDGLDSKVLDKLDITVCDEYRRINEEIKNIMNESRTEANYERFYHHLLWLDENVSKNFMKKYNMSEVSLMKKGSQYQMEVQGLSEKRPSLLRGDKVIISRGDKPKDQVVEFEGIIERVMENDILIKSIDRAFEAQFSSEAVFNVRFVVGRYSRECMHAAVAKIVATQTVPRLFPKPVTRVVNVPSIARFYNPCIESNREQRAAVEHIVAKSSGMAPYMVFGPPGTGKTVTIVEAIIQIVTCNPKHQVWVCTDSNMAADHVALQLIKFQSQLKMDKFLFRASSRDRAWNILPKELLPVSNGSTYENSYSVNNSHLSKYRVIVSTLLHSAKYSSPASQAKHKLKVSHLFIDEASQALEPASLVPMVGLLAPNGQLVLAGDPQQLGPVVCSRKAKKLGLGTSLMEKLYKMYPELYDGRHPHRYITMLVNNFRSHADILEIPNQHFYENKLQVLARPDPLSRVNILGLEGGQRAIVFHGLNSKDQKIGKSPSYFNEKELEMLQRYVKALIVEHKVKLEDIGIISPYQRQVSLIKDWLLRMEYRGLEVGTVEAFQGKEKRVMLVSTVRANCDLLGYDSTFNLGFVADKKRFNVAVTRAKAKLIVIGNKSCLGRDPLWSCYMDRCRQLNSYYGQNTEMVERTDELLEEIAVTRFNRCHLSSALAELDLTDEN